MTTKAYKELLIVIVLLLAALYFWDIYFLVLGLIGFVWWVFVTFAVRKLTGENNNDDKELVGGKDATN